MIILEGNNGRELLSPNEAADLLRYSRRWIYEKVQTGELPSLRVGPGPRAGIRIRRIDALRMLEERPNES